MKTQNDDEIPGINAGDSTDSKIDADASNASPNSPSTGVVLAGMTPSQVFLPPSAPLVTEGNLWMAQNMSAIPLGLPGQTEGLPTAPTDLGDEVQDRFRYQWAIGVVLLAEGIVGNNQLTALWCEHYDDFLIELASGNFVAVQVKTIGNEQVNWRTSDNDFIKSIKRFCDLEATHGTKIERFEFCSNAKVYVPGVTAKDPKSLSSSPERLKWACSNSTAPASIDLPYKDGFDTLAVSASTDPTILFNVMQKLAFRLGPPLRGYLDTLVAKVVPALPGCSSLPNPQLQLIRDELMGVVETACGIPTSGLDGVLAYLASNGKPEVNIRGKCITLEAAKISVAQARQSTFRYVSCGSGLPLGKVGGQRDVLHRKMRNAYLEGNFESIWMRAISAEKRLMEMALTDAENFSALADQLEGAILAECQDAEVNESAEPDERKRGPAILRAILKNLKHLADNEPAKLGNEPMETLVGVAGMLSGSCRFAWGTPLEEEKKNGA